MLQVITGAAINSNTYINIYNIYSDIDKLVDGFNFQNVFFLKRKSDSTKLSIDYLKVPSMSRLVTAEIRFSQKR